MCSFNAGEWGGVTVSGEALHGSSCAGVADDVLLQRCQLQLSGVEDVPPADERVPGSGGA